MINPLNPPGVLRSTARFYKAAKQIEKVEPLVAYYCRFYAVNQGLKLPRGNADEASKFLSQMLTVLENDHAALAEALADPETVQEHFKNFALRVFKFADDVDRAGKATKNTSRDYLHASVFLEAYEQFEVAPDVVQLKTYAKWKAVQILNAIKNGEVPTPGGEPSSLPPMDLEETSCPSPLPTTTTQPTQNHSKNSQTLSFTTTTAAQTFPQPTSLPYPSPSPAFGATGPPQAPSNGSASALSQPPLPTYVPYNAGFVPSEEALMAAMQQSKYVLSALQFEDIPTAVKNLRQCLAFLTGPTD